MAFLISRSQRRDLPGVVHRNEPMLLSHLEIGYRSAIFLPESAERCEVLHETARAPCRIGARDRNEHSPYEELLMSATDVENHHMIIADGYSPGTCPL